MAFAAILHKLAPSLAPLASRLAWVNRNHHSAIFIASSHLSWNPTTSSSFVPIFRFSSAVETKKPSPDESLIPFIDLEIKCAVEETDGPNRLEWVPSGFPFKIEDIPGQPTEYQDELEAMMKDTLERAREPNLNLKGYLQSAYIHPIFKSDDDDHHHDTAFAKKEDEDVLVPTKRHSRRNTPALSKISGGSSPSLPEAVQEHQEP